jgi:hypothetical protein
LPDEQAAAPKSQSGRGGPYPGGVSSTARRRAGVICENMRAVLPEIMASMPQDGASQHDHYIYGWPKKEA